MKKYENFCNAFQNLQDIYDYNKEIALDIINQTKDRFYNMFETLKNEIDTKWL